MTLEKQTQTSNSGCASWLTSLLPGEKATLLHVSFQTKRPSAPPAYSALSSSSSRPLASSSRRSLGSRDSRRAPSGRSPGRASSQAALSGTGRRASRRRDAHTNRAGSPAGTVGTALPGRARPSASRNAQHSPVRDQLRDHWRLAVRALGTPSVPTRPEVTRPVQTSRPTPGFQFSAELRVLRPTGLQLLGLPLRRHRVVPSAGSRETGSRPHCGSAPRERGMTPG